MKKLVLFLLLSLGHTCISCQCSNSNLAEFEGEHYDRTEDDKKKITKGHDKKNPPSKSVVVKKKVAEGNDKNASSFLDIGLPISETKMPIIHRKSYSLSYNSKLKLPNWVIWHLISEHSDGPVRRSNAFYEDEEVPAPRATIDDYRGSGWSRGHMCPAGDNKWDETAMYESFSLINVCPQDASLNSGLWNRIEIDCRRWAQKFGSVYIVCGPVLYNQEHETIGVNKVVVPEAFFKVVLCLEGKPKAIGFVVKNNAGTKKKDQYVNTVDEVERITGYDFFPALPDGIENEVEAHASIDDWR